jgi:DNA-binding PadR family transcriptional regulator
MTGSFMGNGFTGRRGGSAENWPFAAVWEAMEQVRGQFEQKVGPRMARGDVRAAILALLAEGPMHGYQIIHEIEERSGGAWKPSPGSVYPTLQLLADEEIVAAKESHGRKIYSLTEEGKRLADAAKDQRAPWEAPSARDGARPSPLVKAGIALAQATSQVARSDNPEHVKQAVAALDDARRKLYSILAKD